MTRDRKATEAHGFAFGAFLRTYRYVLFHLLTRMESRNVASPIFRALAAMALLVFLNLAWVAFMGIFLLTAAPFFPRPISRLEALPVLAVFFVFYVLAESAWISNGKISILRHEFDGASPTQQRVRSVMFWTYAALSTAALPLTGIVEHALR